MIAIGASGIGADLYGGTGFTNGSSGSSSALISGNTAVRLSSYSAATITNFATITGNVGISVFASGTVGQTVTDSGTIIGTGGAAIAFGAGNDRLKFVPGDAFIQGTVNGGSGTNALDFASGVSFGTLTGSNADFVNFQTAGVDAGANWVFAGSNTLGANTTFTDAGTLTNAGTLVVDPPITVTGTFINSDLITASGAAAVQLAPGAYLLNTGSGTIIGDGANPVITSQSGTASSVVNLGTITNTGTAAGLRFLGSADVINGTSGASSALI